MVHLAELAAQHLAAARGADSREGRSAQVVHRSDRLRITLLALTAGAVLSDHTAPDGTALQVLQGRVRLSTSESSSEFSWDGAAGDLVAVPAEVHRLTAVEDAVVMLSVPLAAAES